MNRTALLLALACAILLPGCVVAWGSCDHTAPRAASIDTRGARLVRIEARAGELEIVGREGLEEVRATGTACADSEDRLATIELVARRQGDVIEIVVDIPDGGGNAGLDLHVEVPRHLPLEVRDSSGDMKLHGVAAAEVRDSSGDIHVEDVEAELSIEDSSGDIVLRDISGRVTVSDSSGNIEVERAQAVEIAEDSSGDIDLRDVEGDVLVRRDSSGSIDVARVGGDFVVERDGSGGIRHSEVAGRVDVPLD